MFLNGNFVSQTAFQQRYGVLLKGSDPPAYAIPTKWQSALFQSGQCGAFIGVFLAGPVTNRLGYRWTTIMALMLMNATIFISFFVSTPSLPLCSSPDKDPLGRFPRGPYCRTGAGRRALGILHCECSRLRQRDRASCPSRCLHGQSADVLVYWWYHRRCRHLWLQQARRSMGLAGASGFTVDFPRGCLHSNPMSRRTDTYRLRSWY